jgi:hypothetical protein
MQLGLTCAWPSTLMFEERRCKHVFGFVFRRRGSGMRIGITVSEEGSDGYVASKKNMSSGSIRCGQNKPRETLCAHHF